MWSKIISQVLPFLCVPASMMTRYRMTQDDEEWMEFVEEGGAHQRLVLEQEGCLYCDPPRASQPSLLSCGGLMAAQHRIGNATSKWRLPLQLPGAHGHAAHTSADRLAAGLTAQVGPTALFGS